MVSDLSDACFCTAPRSYLPGYCVFVLCRPTSQPGPRLSIPIYPTARHCVDIVYFDKNSSVALTFFPSTETTTWLNCPGFSWRSLAHHRFSRRLCHWSGRRVEAYSSVYLHHCRPGLRILRSAMLITFQKEKKKSMKGLQTTPMRLPRTFGPSLL